MNKKICTLFSALSAAVLLTVGAFMGAVGAAKAEAVTTEPPKPQIISLGTLGEYKDRLFYSDSFAYTADYSLNYRYYKPADAKGSIPLVVCLHGRGERGSDNDSQLNNAFVRPFIENENSKFYGAMVIAPQCPVKDFNNGWVNLFDNEDDAKNLNYKSYSVDATPESVECKAIVALIEQTCKKNNIDRSRIYLIGLSQGAMATWDLLARHGDIFAAAVPIAGVGDPQKASVYADIPIYAFHGTADTTVKYDRGTTVMYEAINAVGKNKMNFVSFTDGQHAIWESAIVYKGDDKLPALEDWLFSQKKPTKDAGFNYVAVIVPVAVGAAVVIAAVVTIVVIRKKKGKSGE